MAGPVLSLGDSSDRGAVAHVLELNPSDVASGLGIALARIIPRAPGAWWSPALFDGRRELAAWRGTCALPIDVDHIAAHATKNGKAPQTDVHRLLAAHADAPGSWLHVTARGGARIIAVIDREIDDPDEHKRAASALVERVEMWLAHHGLAAIFEVDRAASLDRARLWWSPPTSAQIHGTGEVVSLDDLLAEADERDAIIADSTSPPATTDTTKQGTLRLVAKTPSPVERAKAYLTHAEPAIQGQHGSKVAFRVIERVVRGFDLNDADALDALTAWNARCVPPWRTEPESPASDSLLRLIQRGRELGNTAARSLVDAPAPTADGGITIQVDSYLHKAVDASELALAANAPDIFARGGQIVRVVPRALAKKQRVAREVGSLCIKPMSGHAVRDVLSAVASWQKYDQRKEQMVATKPPADVAEALLARGHWSKLRNLTGISTSPVLRADGTVASTNGYDEATGYVIHSDIAITVPDAPSRDEAIAAAHNLLDLVNDFPWQRPEDESAWLAFVLTLVCRTAISGPAPMFVVTANVRGAGKSRTIDAASIIVTGKSSPRATQPHDDAECGKLLTSIAIEGDAVVNWDNIDRPLCGGKLDAWLTGEYWSDRVLGSNTKIELPITTVLAATGNNVEIRGDTVRRVLPIRLESPLERPEERADFKIQDLLGHVRDHRAELLSDVLTIARAWFAAGSPTTATVRTWGSYENWVAIVPQIIAWLGLPDPQATRDGLEDNDPTLAAMRTVITRWEAVEKSVGTAGLTVRELVDRVFISGTDAREGFADIANALEALAPGRGRDRVDVRRLGYALRGAKSRNIGGKRLTKAATTHEGGLRWTVR